MSGAAELDIREYLRNEKDRIDRVLAEIVPPEQSGLHEAMAYSLAAGGKRLRPILAVSAFRACGGQESGDLYRAACALELIHTYTLIHDDLPVMDNDDFRRGLPTCHRRFGERRAVLAGSGLLLLAFEVLARSASGMGLDSEIVSRAVASVAEAVGGGGVIGGQVVDLESEGRQVDRATLGYIHTHKTGALIRVSCTLGALLARADRNRMDALAAYGEDIGLAFQIVDDLLDIEGDFAVLGKTTGADQARGKATFPVLYGLEESRRMAAESVTGACGVLKAADADRDGILSALAGFILDRKA